MLPKEDCPGFSLPLLTGDFLSDLAHQAVEDFEDASDSSLDEDEFLGL